MRKVLIAAAIVVAGTGARAQTSTQPICSTVGVNLHCDARMPLQQPTEQQRQQLAVQYEQAAEARRANALQLAALARQGAPFPADASAKIRSALSDDIDQWRDQFQVERKAWKAMRDRWLVGRGTLTPQQWALQRADWFAARDAWIANH